MDPTTHLTHRPIFTQGGTQRYVGRFAPSPSGPLPAGSLATALASWLDARAHEGRWLVRIEDVDKDRCDPSWVPVILEQLARCGLQADAEPVWQSQRSHLYESALLQLSEQGQLYACGCSRHDIRLACQHLNSSHATLEGEETPYPGTCRDLGLATGTGRAIRVRCGSSFQPLRLTWEDRRLGLQHQNLTQQVGDFVLKRRDGLWAYQLAVVVDDADQGITHVVRGEDLSSNTARQIHLQHLLSYPTLRYLHAPLVLDEQHRKLSKHTGAPAVALNSTAAVMSALRSATQALQLGLPDEVWRSQRIGDALAAAVKVWRQQWNPMA